MKVLDAVFVKSATGPEHYPPGAVPEVAFAGRSNVGKSSMINALTHRKKLVRVSNTPGRTKTLNFFDVTVESHGAKRVLRLCDLPGYGFAKVSKTERAQWHTMIERYVQERTTLGVVVCIVDAEVGPTSDDLEMLDFLQDAPPKILVAATKIDRLGKSYRKPKLLELSQQLEVPLEAIVGFSAVENIGHDEVWGRLVEGLDHR